LQNLETGAESAWTAVNLEENGSLLTAKMSGSSKEVTPLTVGVEVRAVLLLDDRRYSFEARCLGPSQHAGEGLLLIECPKVITAIERRRSRRHEFRRPAEVTLEGIDGLQPGRSRGKLLNLSKNGMACRIPAEDAAHIAVGSTLRVMFLPGEDHHGIDVKGRVTNVTRGASAEHAIVGMEFIGLESPSFPREVFQKALADTV
jgi:hypothetical protein